MQLISRINQILLPSLITSFCAATSSLPDMSFSGFATLGISQTITKDDKEGTFDGMSNAIDYSRFNRLGLRLDSNLYDKLSFTLQAVAYGKNDFKPKVDWAFVNYHASNNLKFSLGKQRLPLYMFSEYNNVSYAYQWIDPPYSVYSEPSFDSFDGAKMSYTADLGGQWTTIVDIWLGRLVSDLDSSGIDKGGSIDFIIDDLLGASISIDRDWFSLRAVYMQSSATSDITHLLSRGIAGFTHYGTPAQEILASEKDIMTLAVTPYNNALLNNDFIQFTGLGASLDFNKVFFNAEITYILSEPNIIAGKNISFYILAGYRAPWDLTFSLTFAKDFDRPSDNMLKGFDSDFDQAARSVLDQLETTNPAEADLIRSRLAGLKTFSENFLVNNYAKNDSDTYTFSGRWDFHPAASLKAEFLHRKHHQLGYTGSPQAIRMAIDLVF